MGKALVVYYSYSNGNTKRIAELAAKALHADLAEIQMETPYTGAYDEVIAQGQREVEQGFMPRIKPLAVDLSRYDTVAVGTPTWWYTMTPAVLTFLSENDWRGKTVIPFMTNGGWPGHVLKDMKKACTGAAFQNEKEIRFDSDGGAEMVTSEQEVKDWLKKLQG